MSIYQALKNGQAAVEFIVLIVILFSVFLVYTVNTRSQMDEIRDKKEYALLNDVAKTAQNEILTAVKVEDGYRREFELPDTLEGINYSINITGIMVVAYSENHEQALIIPQVNGTIKKGVNVITKENGIVNIE